MPMVYSDTDIMNVIQPNCRVHFTAADLDFIVHTLTSRGSTESLVKLMADPESLDQILDHDLVFRALLEHNGCLAVSKYFYFYVMVRRVLQRSGIEDRHVADYVAAVLAEFSSATRARNPLAGAEQPMDYLFEMLAALQQADDGTRFLIRAHVGNHSLFLSGVFPERVHYRAQFRGAPEIAYYETLGSANFRVASDHRLAQKYDLVPIFVALAEQFHTIRLALNDMTDRLISLGDPPCFLTQPEHNSGLIA